MDPIEPTTTSNVDGATLTRTSSTVSSADNVIENKSEYFRKKLAESPNCLLCNAKTNGPNVYKHYIECTSIFLKELQNSFVPSSILSYCIDKELLESVFQSPVYVPQLQTLIAQMNGHLNTIQAAQNPAPTQVASPTNAKVDNKKKK